jgi:hypothetical protein
MKRFAILLAIVPLAFAVPSAWADWKPGDPYKMHYPQLPDPTGWDVNATWPKVLADDWRCTETGPVSDIHFWGSYYNDQQVPIESIHLSIHKDIPADPAGGYSRPGELLWERDLLPGQWTQRVYGQGPQGWYDPNTGQYIPNNHNLIWQYNVDPILDPFIQQVGEIYWLDISVKLPPGVAPVWGWKTSREHFNDDAVWTDVDGTAAPFWRELRDPLDGHSLDLAFVITPESASLMLLAAGGLMTLGRRRSTRH